MHILSLQPYYGGSHKAFQLGWQERSCHEWTILALPPRHWKWRMRHAAVHYAELLAESLTDNAFDAIFCSDFLNLAEFKGLVKSPIRDLPAIVYFHENQFAYPSRRYDERDLHFGFTNFTSGLAADQIWFNSAFNRDSFFEGLELACQKWPDYPPMKSVESLRAKCRIEPPGINFGNVPVPELTIDSPNDPISIVWAARWEHDKNPQLLLEALQQLQQRGINFRISVIGESFRRMPEQFDLIRDQFVDQIDRWGFQSREDYWATLRDSQVFISTADHEFFGIAAAEAIACGAFPLLPNRLAYPELVGAAQNSVRSKLFLYDGTASDMAEKIEYFTCRANTQEVRNVAKQLQVELASKLEWQTRAHLMDQQIAGICGTSWPIG